MARLPAQEMAAKLRWAIQTAMNDDLSAIGTEKRKRHCDRLDIMSEAQEWIEQTTDEE